MAKVEPLLWTLSDIVWLPRGLHHRHGLSLANISMRLAALTGWPLPCNTHTHTLKSSTPKQSQWGSVSAFASLHLSKTTLWRTTRFSWFCRSLWPSFETLDLSCHSICKKKDSAEISTGQAAGHGTEWWMSSMKNTPDLLPRLPDGEADPPVSGAQWSLGYVKSEREKGRVTDITTLIGNPDGKSGTDKHLLLGPPLQLYTTVSQPTRGAPVCSKNKYIIRYI